MSTMADHIVPSPVYMEDFIDLSADPDAESEFLDPHLSMPFFTNIGSKEPEQLTVDPSIWSNPINPFADSPETYDIPLPHEPTDVDDNTNPPKASAPTNAPRMSLKTSRTSSKSSVPSLSSGSSSPGARQARARVNKQKEAKELKGTKRTRGKGEKEHNPPKEVGAPNMARATKAVRSKPNMKKEIQVSEDDNDEDAGEYAKRSKYLERNRIAASKCRQKKKAWVCDLETQKTELEAAHAKLQREYNALVNQVTQLKTDLMGHASCSDPNIDGWIDCEARRFVQRSTDSPEEGHRRISCAGPLERDQSHGADSLIQSSPAMSAGDIPLSPIVKHEDINYDHMPDDMFD